MKEVDVRGLSCPEPGLLVKNELKNNNEALKILINQKHTLKNVQSFLDEAKKTIKQVLVESIILLRLSSEKSVC